MDRGEQRWASPPQALVDQPAHQSPSILETILDHPAPAERAKAERATESTDQRLVRNNKMFIVLSHKILW